MTTYGLTPDGFVAKTLEDIEASIVARQRADIDPNLDTSQYEVIGQLNAVVADELAQLWELAEALHDAMDPDKATGDSQDALYALTGTLREGASKSTVIATVTLSGGTNIAAGDAQASVVGNPAAKFVNVTAMVNAGGSSAPFPVLFRAVDTGPVAANAGTLTNIDTPRVGWEAITNALDADLGADIEADPLFRVRRIDELAAQGGGSAPSLRADLLGLPTVLAASVVENDTDATVNGQPPHSLEAVVRSVQTASDDADIANLIWRNKVGGIQLIGSVSVNIVDDEGVTRTVKFSRPTVVPIYIALRLRTGTGYLGDTVTKQAIVDTLEDQSDTSYLDVGVDVYAGRVIAIAMLQPGVFDADARVSTASIPDFTTAPHSVVTASREIAVVDTSRITVSPLP